MDFDGVTSLVSQDLIDYRSDTSTSGARTPYGLYNSLSTLHIGCSSDRVFTLQSTSFAQTPRNTRYGWLAKPYPTGTYTGAGSRLQDASSLLDALTPQAAERANVLAQPVRGFPMTWFVWIINHLKYSF